MYYLETGSVDPAYNLAFEQYILENRMTGDYLLLWQNANTIVVGRNQNPAEEIDSAYVTAHQIRVVRRMTGGGTVYHDLGNLNYSFITDAGAPEEHTVTRFTLPVCRALEKMGVPAESSGRNDILVAGKKVSGVAERLYKNRILHHGCILFAADTSVLSAALKPDPSKFRSKNVKSVSSRVGNIRDFLAESMEMEEFWRRLKGELLRNDGMETRLEPAELEEVNRIAEEKYRSWNWTYGHTPAFSYSNTGRFSGGTVRLQLNIRHGIITEAAFSGDYMALIDGFPAEQALVGCRTTAEAVRSALSVLPLTELFGSVTLEELMTLTEGCLTGD